MDSTIDLDTELFCFGKILALQRLQESYRATRDRLKEISQPILTDWDIIPELYEVFMRVFSHRPQSHPVYLRQKFLFVILYLFCPESLAGEKMPRGLRPKLAKIFRLKSATPISDNCSSLIFLYQNYIDFSRDVGIFYKAVMEHIQQNEQ